MTRISDLEHSIRDTYALIHKGEQKIALSDRPKEKARLKQDEEDLWQRVREYFAAYLPLCARRSHRLPEDLAEIALGAGLEIHESRFVPDPRAEPTPPRHIFLCYKSHAEPDHSLAQHLHDALTAQGHTVFIDQAMRAGTDWLDEIDRQIQASDFLIVLLSQASADSEMVQGELRRAYAYRKLNGHPHTLPVRIAYEGLLPYAIEVFLNARQYVLWRDEADTGHLLQEIQAALRGQLPDRAPVQREPVDGTVTFAEDGRALTDDRSLSPPLPEFDPRFLEDLDAPGGAVKLRDRLYIARAADARFKREVLRRGTTTTIRAPRQTGKTSLLVRGLHHARQEGAKLLHLNLQRVDEAHLQTLDSLLRYLADFMAYRLRLNVPDMAAHWARPLSPQHKLTFFMEDYILPEGDATPVILAFDEADVLLDTPWHTAFFALLRSWHEERAMNAAWNNLNLVLVISTEPYLLIANAHQSPFNVGLRLYLEDFDAQQVAELNRRHYASVEDADFAQLMDLLNGHPYLVRKALYTMVTERCTWQALYCAAATDHGPFGDHLRRYHMLLRDDGELCDALRQVIRHERCGDDRLFFRLLRAGLVKGSGDTCACRCDLYRRYFEDKV